MVIEQMTITTPASTQPGPIHMMTPITSRMISSSFIAHHTPMIFSAIITSAKITACRKINRTSSFHVIIPASYLTLNSLTVPQVRQR